MRRCSPPARTAQQSSEDHTELVIPGAPQLAMTAIRLRVLSTAKTSPELPRMLQRGLIAGAQKAFFFVLKLFNGPAHAVATKVGGFAVINLESFFGLQIAVELPELFRDPGFQLRDPGVAARVFLRQFLDIGNLLPYVGDGVAEIIAVLLLGSQHVVKP